MLNLLLEIFEIYMNAKAKEYIEKLQLLEHPEGGYFKEVYRSEVIINKDYLPQRYSSDRCLSTSIYFLLEGKQFSALHRLKSDEIWHHIDGVSVKIFVIDENGKLTITKLGKNIKDGDVLQTVIKRSCWFGAEILDETSFTLVSCTVAPGFDFADFELGKREELLELFPEHKELVLKLTK